MDKEEYNVVLSNDQDWVEQGAECVTMLVNDKELDSLLRIARRNRQYLIIDFSGE
tara:strand:+ start:103 stop:267 length:165 start_codon:yes stop_codon:yes gene_type:complete